MILFNMKYLYRLLILIAITYAESELEKPPLNINRTEGLMNQSITVAEGGVSENINSFPPPNGREGYTEVPKNNSSSVIPVHEEQNTKQNITTQMTIASSTNHKITAKKGVTPLVEPKQNITVLHRPKKPNITEPGGNNSFAPSHFQLSDKLNSSSKILNVPNPNIINDSSQDNTQKYIVPIVIVILSVPFVAILISVVFKRGAEWWKYRHYRRMDFLINGIYDN